MKLLKALIHQLSILNDQSCRLPAIHTRSCPEKNIKIKIRLQVAMLANITKMEIKRCFLI